MPRLNLIVEAMAKCAFPSKECAIGRMIAEIGKLLFSLRSITVLPTYAIFSTLNKKESNFWKNAQNTVWKLQNFSITKILREINFEYLEVQNLPFRGSEF